MEKQTTTRRIICYECKGNGFIHGEAFQVKQCKVCDSEGELLSDGKTYEIDEGGGQCEIAMNDTDIAYIAGLFDGEGVIIQQYMQKKKVERKPISNQTEIAMTEKSF